MSFGRDTKSRRSVWCLCQRKLPCEIAVRTPPVQAESVPLRRPAKVEEASVIGSYNKIPLMNNKKRATSGLKCVVVEPLLLPEPLCKLKMNGVNLDKLWMAGFY